MVTFFLIMVMTIIKAFAILLSGEEIKKGDLMGGISLLERGIV